MKQKIFKILDELGIEYQNFEHQPAFSCEDAKWIDIPWKRVKSLFIRNKKATKYYMIVLEDKKSFNSNLARKLLQENKLTFASEERMINTIWIKPGHVSPFALINNEENNVEVIFDENLKDCLIWFHPGQNDNTTVLRLQDVEKFLNYIWNEFRYLEL